MKYFGILVVVLMWGLLLPADSYAYLDPGTGSYFLQMLVGIFIGIAFTVKIYWERIKSILTKRKK
ncbi:MAG: hypothetical protein V1919_03860 [Candidatus Omnitrophota bacterium]